MTSIFQIVFSAFASSNDDSQTAVLADNPAIEEASFGLEEEDIFATPDLDPVKKLLSTFFDPGVIDIEDIFPSGSSMMEFQWLLSTPFFDTASAYAPFAIFAVVALLVLALINYIQHSQRFHWISTRDATQMKPFNWYIALDGHYMASFSGGAGVMKIEFPSCKVTSRYYPGVSYGHAVDVSPDGRWLFLGNYSQQITIIEASSMELVTRMPLTEIEDFEVGTFRLLAPVFAVWLTNNEFLVALPKNVWKITMKVLPNARASRSTGIKAAKTLNAAGGTTGSNASSVVTLSYTRVCTHHCDSPHQMLYAAKTSTLIMADTGSEESRPRRVELINVPNLANNTFDRSKVTNKILNLQDDIWHMALDPESGTKIYAATYSKFDCVPYQVRDRSRFFGVGYERNYIYEICTEKQNVSRIFSGSVAVPLHLNSDHVVANGKLLIGSGSSHDGFELDLNDFATWRVIPCGPSVFARWFNLGCWINSIQNVVDGITHFPFMLQAMAILFQTNEGRFMNGIYAMEVSPCQNYIVMGHRDYNYIRLVDAKTHRTITKFFLPTTPCPGEDRPSWLQARYVTRHGLHHSCTSEEYRPQPMVVAPVA